MTFSCIVLIMLEEVQHHHLTSLAPNHCFTSSAFITQPDNKNNKEKNLTIPIFNWGLHLKFPTTEQFRHFGNRYGQFNNDNDNKGNDYNEFWGDLQKKITLSRALYLPAPPPVCVEEMKREMLTHQNVALALKHSAVPGIQSKETAPARESWTQCKAAGADQRQVLMLRQLQL